MAPISSDLSRISKSTAELNQLADEVTAQLRMLDEHLDRFCPGVEAPLMASPFDYDREQNSRGHRVDARYYLKYARDDEGKFGIVVEAYAQVTDQDGVPERDDDNEPDVWETVWVRRLSTVRRDLRLKALPKLPDLITQIADAAESAVVSASKHLSSVRDVAGELKAALASVPPPAAKSAGVPPPQASRGRLVAKPGGGQLALKESGGQLSVGNKPLGSNSGPDRKAK